ncbi:hypothetical protein [Pseudomonas protegens]|uniref:hypothetical protein n=1 Tax=Pseudomonas protegens TaxID=380021 RepID=UPI0022645907|nr:hypothetical protein [Pseudomonas protegens]
MKRTVVLTGKAVVTFRKVIEGLDEEELAELQNSIDHQEDQIDDDDLRDIEWIDQINMEVRP